MHFIGLNRKNKQINLLLIIRYLYQVQQMGNQCDNQSAIQTIYLNETHGYPLQIEIAVSELRKNVATEAQLLIHKKSKNQVFRGNIQDGKKNGYGEYINNRNSYYGEFYQDLPHGRGIMISSQMDYIKGHFKKGKPHGQGYEKIGDIIFQGKFYKGQRRKGILKTNDCEYDGQFINNKFQGMGTLNLNTGQTYEGQFKNGLFQGIGKYSTNKGIYNGHFKEGKYQGRGLYRWNDGSFYDGEYVQGIKNGFGRFVKDHFCYEGEWKNGKFIEKTEEKNKIEGLT